MMTSERGRRPRLAVFKFASCDGCQLSVLNLEDDLLALGEAVDIVFFPEASSRMEEGPYDVALVEGSITTADDAERILEVRRQSEILITIGACATAGGIQALRNWTSVEAFRRAIYPNPEYVATLDRSTPIALHVRVDLELWGCPIDKEQLRHVLADLLGGVRPRVSGHSVCLECKRRGHVCVLVARGLPCLGPVTRTGCGAICPGMGRECYGCFGPMETVAPGPGAPPNTASLAGQFQRALGLTPVALVRRFRGINGYTPAFREAGDTASRAVAGGGDGTAR